MNNALFIIPPGHHLLCSLKLTSVLEEPVLLGEPQWISITLARTAGTPPLPVTG